MARIQLRLYVDPGEAEVFLQIKQRDGGYTYLTAIIDTGAAVSLFPIRLLPNFDHRLSGSGVVTIDQAGITQQSFQATEAFISIFLEDMQGNQTGEFEIRAWFAETDFILLGFDGILDRAILYLDMLDQREGWIEMRV